MPILDNHRRPSYATYLDAHFSLIIFFEYFLACQNSKYRQEIGLHAHGSAGRFFSPESERTIFENSAYFSISWYDRQN